MLIDQTPSNLQYGCAYRPGRPTKPQNTFIAGELYTLLHFFHNFFYFYFLVEATKSELIVIMETVCLVDLLVFLILFRETLYGLTVHHNPNCPLERNSITRLFGL
jgi:hypothetical protein